MERSLYFMKIHLFSFSLLPSCVTGSFSCQCKAIQTTAYVLPQAFFFLHIARLLSDSEQEHEIHLCFLWVFFRTEIQTHSLKGKKKVYVVIGRIVLLLGFFILRIRLLSKFTAREERKKKHWILKETHRLVITVVGYLYGRHFNYNIIKSMVIEVLLGPDQKVTGLNRATMSYFRSVIIYCEFI